MKNTTILFILLFSFSYVNSQKLSKEKVHRLNELKIKTENFNLNDFSIQKDLNKILTLEIKRKTNKTVGFILSSISVAGIIIGSILVSRADNPGCAIDSSNKMTGMLMIGGGAVFGGVSIPFWISSKKRRKEEDKLMKMFDK